MSQHLHVIDGFGYIFRAYYGLMGGAKGVQLSNSSGMPTGALYVYARMLIKLHKELGPERIVVVFDHPGKTFRSDLDPEYKANRKETPEDLVDQLPFFRPLTEAFCWPVISAEGFEADDLIATVVTQAKKKNWKVTIWSGDKDLMQLVTDELHVVDALRNITYDKAKVVDKFGVPPEQVRDWLALVGDKSDNVPGMPGVGKVTATKLLTAYENLEGILANTSEMKGKQKERFEDETNIKQLKLSQKLVTLREDAPLEIPIDEMVPSSWDPTPLSKVFGELEFFSLLESIESAKNKPKLPEKTDVTLIADQAAGDLFAKTIAVGKEVTLFPVTTGKRWTDSNVLGLAIAVTDGPVGYLELRNQNWQDVAPSLRKVLASENTKIVCHDGKSMNKRLRKIKIELSDNVYDVMLAYFLTGSGRDASDHSKLLSALGVSAPPLPKKLNDKSDEELGAYAGRVCVLLNLAKKILDQQMDKVGVTDLLQELEQPVSEVLARIEETGVLIDTEKLAKISETLHEKIAGINDNIKELAGTDVNVASPKQLSELLFNTLGLTSPKKKKTKTGFSTDAEVLESLADKHPIVPLILEHREKSKLLGTYVDAIPPLINKDTGRLHTNFAQAIAATGRLSSRNPNLQNIPIRTPLGRLIREAFIAADGHVILSADYSQIELRVIAHLSGDEVLVKAFSDGIDVHSQTASEILGIPLKDVDQSHRRIAKAVNYGLVYGQTAFGLSRALGIPRKEAKQYIDTYFERFSGVAAYMEQTIVDAKEAGFAKTMFGRVRPVPDVRSGNFMKRKAAERVAQNTPVQGAAADIMKRAMLAVDARLTTEKIPAKVILTVHDELVLEVKEGALESAKECVSHEMMGAAELSVPLVVDTGVGAHWGAAHG